MDIFTNSSIPSCKPERDVQRLALAFEFESSVFQDLAILQNIAIIRSEKDAFGQRQIVLLLVSFALRNKR